MSVRRWVGVILLAALLCGVLPSTGAAERDAAFRMAIEAHRDEVTVTVYADQVSDLFAFDLILETDDRLLKLNKAMCRLGGFPVGPIAEGREMRYACTKVGQVPGITGDAILAEFSFKRLSNETAAIRLKQVQLVDSGMNMTTYKPKLEGMATEMAVLRDIEGHWARAEIEWAIGRGIATGYEDGSFLPDRVVTRAHFAALLTRALKLSATSGAMPDYSDKDKLATWNIPYIAAVQEAGLMLGYKDGGFRPDAPITREEIAVIIARMMEAGTAGVVASSFADHDEISEWAKPSVAAATSSGIMFGQGHNRFGPKRLATRAEAVVVLQRAYGFRWFHSRL